MRGRLLALALLLALGAAAEAAPAAPGFRLKLLDSKRSIDSNELIGKKVVVLRFQASYCPPCAKESPALNRVVERYKDRDVEIIAIHVQDTATDVRKFMRANKAAYPVALDPRLSIGNRFGFKGTPFTVVIDRKGEIAARLAGEGAVRRLPTMLDRLLKDEGPEATPPRS
jgi:thiol-disulfide isomerase/thioredoxin